MNRKGFANITLVLTVVILVSTGTYFALAKTNHWWPFWKAYQDIELGYQLKYPRNYSIRKIDLVYILIENIKDNNHYSLQVLDNQDKLTALEYTKKVEKNKTESEFKYSYKKIVVNNVESVEVELTSRGYLIAKTVLIPARDKFVQISYGINEKNTDKEIVEKFWQNGDTIVSSFKKIE